MIDRERELQAAAPLLAGRAGWSRSPARTAWARRGSRPSSRARSTSDGATVLYASGIGPAEVALAAIARAAESRRPALLVLDDADRADARGPARAVLARRGRGACVLATGLQAAALARLEPREALVLEPLDADGGRRHRRLLRPARQRHPGRRAAADEPRGRPPRPRGRERVGAPRGDGARRRARGPHRRRAQRGAGARVRAGRQRGRPAVDARADRGAAGEHAGRLPVQGPGELRPRRRRVLLRSRGPRRGARRAPGRRAAAGGRRPVRERQVLGRCAPGCCPRWRAACCRAASTGRRP